MFRRKDVKIFNVPDWSDTTTKTYDLSTVAGREQVPINLDEIKDICFIYVRENNEYYRLISDTTSGTTRTLVFNGSNIITITKTSTVMTVEFSGIGSSSIQDSSVTSTKLATNSVTTDKIQNGAVTINKIANGIINYVTPEMFGAVGDGITDDTNAWLNAVASGEIIIAKGNYLIKQQILLDNDVYIYGVVYNDVSNGFKINGKARRTYVINVESKHQTSSEYIGVEIVNCNNCVFDVYAKNFYYGIIVNGDITGCAYNTFNNVYIINSKYYIKLLASTNGWVNENYFYNIRCLSESNSLYKGYEYAITIIANESTHSPNANSFINCCCEGTYCAINLSSSQNNHFENIRTEGCTYACITDTASRNNIIEVSYGVITSDLGNGTNIIKRPSNDYILSLNYLIASTGNLANKCADNGTYACADGLYNVSYKNDLRSNNPSIYNTLANSMGISINGNSKFGKLINVEKNKKLLLKANVLNGYYRWVVVPFNQNDEFVSGADIRTAVSAFSELSNTAIGNYYSLTANNTDSTVLIFINTTSITKVFVGILGSSSWTGRIINNLEIYGTADNYEEYSNPVAQLPSIPVSQGYYFEQTVYSTDGTKKWVWDGIQWNEISL